MLPQPISCLLIGVALLSGATYAQDIAIFPATTTYGPDPVLPEPMPSATSTVKAAPVRPWHEGQTPTPPAGFKVQAYATDLDHPRWLYVLPNGDVLVAESDAPEENDGIATRAIDLFTKKLRAGIDSADRITLLRDKDGDGEADFRDEFVGDLHSPFGMALVGNDFYVANTDAVVHFTYEDGDTSLTSAARTITDLPADPINYHWTRNIVASPDGRFLYATVGSNSNNAENGMQAEEGRAAIWKIDRSTGDKQLFATGLRNPNGMDWQPDSGELWVAVNERDDLGDDLVPDYITSVKPNGFYGWPYSYFGQHLDPRMEDEQKPELVASAIKPDYAVGAHTASLGLIFYNGESFAKHYAGGAFVAQHGSWNRESLSGYKVIFVPFKDGRPSGQPEDFLTGFLNDTEEAHGRPVGVAIDKTGALLVADDVGNTIWRVSAVGN